jgi:hypothetical protein
MDTLSLRIKYRPLRIGWCLSAGDFASLKKALQLTHTIWGGRYNPIIPVDDIDFGSQLVNLFRVDFLFPVSEDQKVTTFIKKFSYLPYPFLHNELFLKEYSGKIYPTVVDLYHPIRRLYEENFKNNPNPSFHTTIFKWNDDDPLANVFLSTFGSFPPKEETGTDYEGLIEKHLAAEVIDITGKKALPSDSFKKITPNEICCMDLQRHYSIINHWTKSGFYIGRAQDFNDVVSFWNIRATDTDILFYDHDYSERLDSLKTEYPASLRARPQNPQDPDSHVALWSLRKDDQLEKSAFGSGLWICTLDSSAWNGLNIKAPIMHFGEKSVLASVGHDTNKIRVSFSLPEKPAYNQGHLNQQHLVASIDKGIGLFGNEQATLMTPYIPELNEYYGRNFYFDWNEVRVEPESIGIIITVWREDLSLSALNVTSLLSKIFEVAGIKANPSKPGLIASRLIQQLGGLQGCRVFKIAGVRNLIKKYKPDQSFTKGAATQIIANLDPLTNKPNFSDYEDLFLESRPWSKKLKPNDVFTYLLKHGVFRVGLKFECPHCNLDFWLSLDDIKTQTTCEYCGRAFNVTTQLKDRDWNYRRSGLFGKENNQEGGIPVALTLQQIDTVYKGLKEMIYTTAMELVPAGASINRCETDFVVLTQSKIDHKIQIVIGECKNHEEIAEDDVLKLKKVAEALEKKGVQVFVIFSKISDFTPEELERCKIINEKSRRRLILFTGRELEPYRLYEKTEKEFDIERYAVSFENMVDVTQAVFYEQRRKSLQTGDTSISPYG